MSRGTGGAAGRGRAEQVAAAEQITLANVAHAAGQGFGLAFGQLLAVRLSLGLRRFPRQPGVLVRHGFGCSEHAGRLRSLRSLLFHRGKLRAGLHRLHVLHVDRLPVGDGGAAEAGAVLQGHLARVRVHAVHAHALAVDVQRVAHGQVAGVYRLLARLRLDGGGQGFRLPLGDHLLRHKLLQLRQQRGALGQGEVVRVGAKLLGRGAPGLVQLRPAQHLGLDASLGFQPALQPVEQGARGHPTQLGPHLGQQAVELLRCLALVGRDCGRGLRRFGGRPARHQPLAPDLRFDRRPTIGRHRLGQPGSGVHAAQPIARHGLVNGSEAFRRHGFGCALERVEDVGSSPERGAGSREPGSRDLLPAPGSRLLAYGSRLHRLQGQLVGSGVEGVHQFGIGGGIAQGVGHPLGGRHPLQRLAGHGPPERRQIEAKERRVGHEAAEDRFAPLLGVERRILRQLQPLHEHLHGTLGTEDLHRLLRGVGGRGQQVALDQGPVQRGTTQPAGLRHGRDQRAHGAGLHRGRGVARLGKGLRGGRRAKGHGGIHAQPLHGHAGAEHRHRPAHVLQALRHGPGRVERGQAGDAAHVIGQHVAGHGEAPAEGLQRIGGHREAGGLGHAGGPLGGGGPGQRTDQALVDRAGGVGHTLLHGVDRALQQTALAHDGIGGGAVGSVGLHLAERLKVGGELGVALQVGRELGADGQRQLVVGHVGILRELGPHQVTQAFTHGSVEGSERIVDRAGRGG